MRKTTITVATLLAVAATPSFAAVQAANSAGQNFTIEEGKTHGSIEITLKEGTYRISKENFEFRVTTADEESTLIQDYAANCQFTIGKEGKTVRITAHLLTGSPEEDANYTIKIEPVTEGFTKLVTSYNQRVSIIFNDVKNKIPELDSGEKKYSLYAQNRADLLDEISAFQDKVNEMGLEEYNDYLDNDKKLPEFDDALAGLEGDSENALANKASYDELVGLSGDLKTEFEDLKTAYAAMSETNKAKAKTAYENCEKSVESFKGDIDDAYQYGDAGKNSDELKNLYKTYSTNIKNTKKVATGANDEDIAYNNINTAVTNRLAEYDNVAKKLQNLLALNADKDVYDSEYKAALAEIQPFLRAVLKVQSDNEAAKEAGNAASKEAGLWTAINNADKTDIEAIYEKYEEKVGVYGTTDVTTWRGKYNATIAAIDNLLPEDSYELALEDGTKDKTNKTVIKDYYATEVGKLKAYLNNMKALADAANKDHKFEATALDGGYYVNVDKNKDVQKFNTDKQTLDKKYKEYTAYWDARSYADNPVAVSLDGYEEDVLKMKSDDEKYEPKTNFANLLSDLRKQLANLKEEARKKYDVKATGTVMQTYLSSQFKTKANNINKDGSTNYKQGAQQALAYYNAVAPQIATFNEEINGNEDEGIKSWAEVVTNEKVTTDGQANSETYGEAKARLQAVIQKAQDLLDKAVKSSYSPEKAATATTEAVGAEPLTTFKAAYDMLDAEDGVNDAIAEVQSLKGKYNQAFVDDWQANVYEAARDAAIEESNKRVDDAEEEVAGYGLPNADKYGKASEQLTKDAKAITDKLATIQDDIDAAELEGDAQKAIALLDKVSQELDKLESDLKTLKADAGKAKTAKANELAAIATITEARDKVLGLLYGEEEGIDYDDDEIPDYYKLKKAAITTGGHTAWDDDPYNHTHYDETLIGWWTSSHGDFTEEVDALAAKLNEIMGAGETGLATATAAETVNAKKQDFLNRISAVAEAASSLRTLAMNEKENGVAYNAWWEKHRTYETVEAVDKSVEDFVDEAKKAIDEVVAGKQTDGEKYFLGQLEATGDEETPTVYDRLTTLRDDVQEAYTVGKKLNDVPGTIKDKEYTDTEKNMTALKATYLQELDDLVDEIRSLATLCKQNEDSHNAQKTAYEAVKKQYDGTFQSVNKDENSGDKYKEAFNKAINTLTEIKADLDKYGEDFEKEYKKGGSQAFDGNQNKIDALRDRIFAVDTEWNGKEGEDGAYYKAVAADNKTRYDKFSKKWDELYAEFYGTDKKEGAVDEITKLSKLTYADQVTDDIKAIVTGNNSIYTYADPIAKVKEEADKDYTETHKAPEIFDETEYLNTAQTLLTQVKTKHKDYCDAVNTAAKETYNKEYAAAKALVDEARAKVKDNLAVNGTNDQNTILNKSKKTISGIGTKAVGAQEIVQYAATIAGASDMAYQLDKVYIPAFDQLPTMLQESLDQEADERWTAFTTIDSDEAADIAEFYGLNPETGEYEQGYNLAKYKEEIVPARAEAKEAYEKGEGEKIVRYKAAMDIIKEVPDAATTTTEWRTSNHSYAFGSHTKFWYKALFQNEDKNDLDKANAELLATQATLTEQLGDAEDYVNSLFVKYDVDLAADVSDIEDDIDGLTVATYKNNTIGTEILKVYEDAVKKEYVALGTELGHLQETYGKDNEDLKDHVAKNETIYSNYTKAMTAAGKLQDADARQAAKEKAWADAQKSFIGLEGEIATTKAQLNPAGVSEAKATITKAIAGLKTAVADVEALPAYDEVTAEFQDVFDALEGAIAEAEATLAASGDDVVLYQDNQLRFIELAATKARATGKEIESRNAVYEIHFAKKAEMEAAIATVTENLKKVYDNSADYIVPENDEDDDVWTVGEEPYHNFRDFLNAQITADIEDEVEASMTLEDGQLYTEASTVNVAPIQQHINQMENFLAYFNAKSDLDKTDEVFFGDDDDEIEGLYEKIETLRVAQPDAADAKEEELDALVGRFNQINQFNKDAWKGVKISKDVSGEPILDKEGKETQIIIGKAKYYKEAYTPVMNALEELRADLDAFKNSFIIPGAISNGQEVVAGDIADIIDLILGITDPEDLSPEQRIAADADGDGEYTVVDLTMIQNMFVYGDYRGPVELWTVRAKAREDAKPVYYGTGSLSMDIATSQIAVNLEKGKSYAAIQMDVTLPAGVELADAAFAGDNEAVSVAFNKIGGNAWRVLISANDNSSVNADEALVSLSIAGEGAGKVAIDNAIAATADAKSVKLAGISGDFTIVTGIAATESKVEGDGTIFGANGVIRKQLEKGLNIIKTAGGAVKKIFVK